MRLFDISRTIGPDAVTYPEDPPPGTEALCVIGDDAPCNITRLTGWTTHFLTHVDAPLHFIQGGPSLDDIDPARFISQALVLENSADAIGPSDVPPRVEIEGKSVLFKTRNSTDPAPGGFDEKHVYLSAEAAAELAAGRANLVAIDYLSVDRYGDDNYPAHRTLLEANVLILEGIDLADVPPGRYMLVALPLKIAGADGSPVRAVLLAGDME
ncbi:MAG: cyclase family protein [Actinomycetota bacterium]